MRNDEYFEDEMRAEGQDADEAELDGQLELPL